MIGSRFPSEFDSRVPDQPSNTFPRKRSSLGLGKRAPGRYQRLDLDSLASFTSHHSPMPWLLEPLDIFSLQPAKSTAGQTRPKVRAVGEAKPTDRVLVAQPSLLRLSPTHLSSRPKDQTDDERAGRREERGVKGEQPLKDAQLTVGSQEFSFPRLIVVSSFGSSLG